MRHSLLFSLLILSSLLFFTACGEDIETGEHIEGDGIHIEGAWARPGSEGRMSAAYFLVSNYSDSGDRIISASSDVARDVEIHESYQQEGDMVGMREVETVDIPTSETVQFRQGGLHIMLIQLTRTLNEGDEFELTLEFENEGDVTLTVPVRL